MLAVLAEGGIVVAAGWQSSDNQLPRPYRFHRHNYGPHFEHWTTCGLHGLFRHYRTVLCHFSVQKNWENLNSRLAPTRKTTVAGSGALLR